jgi:hypothetical protein
MILTCRYLHLLGWDLLRSGSQYRHQVVFPSRLSQIGYEMDELN